MRTHARFDHDGTPHSMAPLPGAAAPRAPHKGCFTDKYEVLQKLGKGAQVRGTPTPVLLPSSPMNCFRASTTLLRYSSDTAHRLARRTTRDTTRAYACLRVRLLMTFTASTRSPCHAPRLPASGWGGRSSTAEPHRPFVAPPRRFVSFFVVDRSRTYFIIVNSQFTAAKSAKRGVATSLRTRLTRSRRIHPLLRRVMCTCAPTRRRTASGWSRCAPRPPPPAFALLRTHRETALVVCLVFADCRRVRNSR